MFFGPQNERNRLKNEAVFKAQMRTYFFIISLIYSITLFLAASLFLFSMLLVHILNKTFVKCVVLKCYIVIKDCRKKPIVMFWADCT